MESQKMELDLIDKENDRNVEDMENKKRQIPDDANHRMSGEMESCHLKRAPPTKAKKNESIYSISRPSNTSNAPEDSSWMVWTKHFSFSVDELEDTQLECLSRKGQDPLVRIISTQLELNELLQWDKKTLLDILRLYQRNCLYLNLKKPQQIEIEINVEALLSFKPIMSPYFLRWLFLEMECVDWDWSFPYPEELTIASYSSGRSSLNKKIRIDVFYSNIERKTPHITMEPNKMLLPELRTYQKEAISWMLGRERRSENCNDEKKKCTETWITFQHKAQPSCVYYFNILSAKVIKEKPCNVDLDEIRGGVLADEMGLGKTVEILGLILANPGTSDISGIPLLSSAQENDGLSAVEEKLKSDLVPSSINVDVNKSKNKPEVDCICRSKKTTFAEDRLNASKAFLSCQLCQIRQHAKCVRPSGDYTNFICIHCIVPQNQLLPSKTTLIISPASIHRQWQQEIVRHTRPGSLSILVYPGVSEVCTGNDLSLLNPTELAKYDVVITTFDTLQRDIHYTNTTARSLRNVRKHRTIPSPLTKIKWWRLCVDEAQFVENKNSMPSEMVAKLSYQHMWCVTGTPVSKSLEDFEGLMYLLNVDPFMTAQSWTQLILMSVDKGCLDRFRHLLNALIWRNRKVDVADQLHLPPQMNQLHWLQFSQIEASFYQQQERDCRNVFHHQAMSTSVQSDNLSSLLRLRQACCHPQVGGFGFGIVAVSRRQMTMAQILDQMIRKAKTEGEDYQRQIIAAQNGLAGLHQIQNSYTSAISAYMKSLSLIKNNWAHYRTDAVQRLHIVVNLRKLFQRVFDFQHFPMDADDQHHRTNISSALIRIEKENIEANDKSASKSVSKDGEGKGDDLDKKAAASEDDEEEKEIGKKVEVAEEVIGENQDVIKEDPSLIPDLHGINELLSTPNLTLTSKLALVSTEIARDCHALQQTEKKIIQKYLWSANVRHEQSFYQFNILNQQVEKRTNTNKNVGFFVAEEAPLILGGKSTPDECPAHACWWIKAVELLSTFDRTNYSFVHQLVSKLTLHAEEMNYASVNFDDQYGLRLVLLKDMEKMQSVRSGFLNELIAMSQDEAFAPEKVHLSGNCHECRQNFYGRRCQHCQLKPKLEEYERSIHGLRVINHHHGNSGPTSATGRNNESSTANNTEQLVMEGDSQVILILKELRRMLQQRVGYFEHQNDMENHALTQELVEQATEHVAILDLMKKELQASKRLLTAQYTRLSCLDELDMSVTMMQLRSSAENLTATPTELLYKVSQSEIPFRMVELESEIMTSASALTLAKTHLSYLTNVAKERKMRWDKRDKTEVCLICQEKFGPERSILPCAHIFCCSCIGAYMRCARNDSSTRRDPRTAVKYKCPTCRRLFEKKKIETSQESLPPSSSSSSSVTLKEPARGCPPPRENHVDLRGDFGTKINYLVSQVLHLRDRDPTAKCIVFSQWNDMLQLICACLSKNGIHNACLNAPKGGKSAKSMMQDTLDGFRTTKGMTVLAITFKNGANGLNLTEANHVFLLEPLLHPGLEAQAINRVHRIGQTRRTTVHRLIIRETVEEKIYSLAKQKLTRLCMEDMKPSRSASGILKSGQDHAVISRSDLNVLFTHEHDMEHEFWKHTRVTFQSQVFPSREALLKEVVPCEGSLLTQTTMTSCFGREISLERAKELLELPTSDDLNPHGSVLRDMIHASLHRVNEEIGKLSH